jgi:hypothetical protein
MRLALNPRLAALALGILLASCGGGDDGDPVPVPDTQNPDVTILSPPAGPVTGTIEVRAAAFDNRGVVGVNFQLDGVQIGTEVSAEPYAINWNTRTATNGNHTLTATAYDEVGNVGTSPGVVVSVSGGI